MGWLGYHWHDFTTEKNQRITGKLEEIDDSFNKDVIDEKKINVSEVFKEPKTSIFYEYDFGDSWVHKLEFVKYVEKTEKNYHGQCIAGKMQCPPEDCGGIYGYKDLLKILKMKDHPEYQEQLEWAKEQLQLDEDKEFDPTFLNLQQINDIIKCKLKEIETMNNLKKIKQKQFEDKFLNQAPKPAQNAFFYFSQEQFPNIIKKGQQISVIQIKKDL